MITASNIENSGRNIKINEKLKYTPILLIVRVAVLANENCKFDQTFYTKNPRSPSSLSTSSTSHTPEAYSEPSQNNYDGTFCKK